MKTSSIALLSFGTIGGAAIALLALGTPGSRVAPMSSPGAAPHAAASPGATASPSVSAGGFSLTSTSVDLPSDDMLFPGGPHADVVNANCTSCHSASMALNQPPLSADQWTAEVTKMREIYKAPVAESDVRAIVAYLTGMSAEQPQAAKAKARGSVPKTKSDGAG